MPGVGGHPIRIRGPLAYVGAAIGIGVGVMFGIAEHDVVAGVGTAFVLGVVLAGLLSRSERNQPACGRKNVAPGVSPG